MLFFFPLSENLAFLEAIGLFPFQGWKRLIIVHVYSKGSPKPIAVGSSPKQCMLIFCYPTESRTFLGHVCGPRQVSSRVCQNKMKRKQVGTRNSLFEFERKQ